MRRGIVLVAALCLLLPLAAALAPAASGAGFCASLKSRLVAGGGQASGLLVFDADRDAVVCGRAPNRQRPLASNMKLFTTATALARLGPRARIATKLLASGPVDSAGVLHGDLYLKGGGDPTLGTPAFYDRWLDGLGTSIFALAAQIRAAGVRRVTGRLYADDTIFDRRRGVPDSGYATSPYIGPLSGLAFNAGYSGPAARSFSPDPAKEAAATLLRSLRKTGVAIRGGVALRAAPADASPLAVVRSPALERIVETTDVYSHNFFAETLLKLLGARFRGRGSTAAGAAVVARFARRHGSGLHAVDGSGLTRSNRASPRQVVGLLEAMLETPVGEEFVEDLPLAGRAGTVAARMRGTAAEGRCRVKTGTLTGVSNLSGYCFTRDGKTMVFSILMSGVRDLTLAHFEQDRIAAAIAAY